MHIPGAEGSTVDFTVGNKESIGVLF